MHKTVSRNAQTHKQKYKHINNQTDTFPSKDNISTFTNTKKQARPASHKPKINEKNRKQ